VLVTALPTIGVMIGANRVLRGVAITNPTGDPTLTPAEELDLRRTIVSRAIEMMETDVPQGSVWEVKGG
jgi:glycine/betaine/sarcosine/D-proline reductase family selenoprotein B